MKMKKDQVKIIFFPVNKATRAHFEESTVSSD